jgi:glycogen debranching enzyme
VSGRLSPWAYTGAPGAGAQQATHVTLVAGTSFCLSSASGDLEPGSLHGLFHRDTRFLSGWQLKIDGRGLEALSLIRDEPSSARFICRVPAPAGRADSTLLVVRSRSVGDGMWEEVVLRNLAPDPVNVEVAMMIQADFAGLFDVKDGHAGVAAPARLVRTDAGLLVLPPDHKPSRRVHLSIPPGAEVRPGSLAIQVTVPARSERIMAFGVTFVMEGSPAAETAGGVDQAARSAAAASAERRSWRQGVAHVRSSDQVLNDALAQGVEDLGALRIMDPDGTGAAVVAAGAPWFMALFGRDSLITSWMTLVLDATMACDALTVLGRHQGRASHQASEEQPGRILHEMRWGLSRTPYGDGQSIYYGTVDATPLFVMLWGELAKWANRPDLINELLPNVDRALDWIVSCAELSPDGFVAYHRATTSGLANQGWKDSWDGINFADGRVARAPIALCEVQGYVYAAYLARASVARSLGDRETDRAFVERAEALKTAFNRSFWLDAKGYFAVGLDEAGQRIDSLTSNIGHCLWTGIIEPGRADLVVRRLMSAEMFTGWGLRTLSAEMGAYNPVSYHNGSVWPHDTALAVAGLVRYGYRREAARLAEGLVQASGFFGGRLPELFCGFDRSEFPEPIAYPTACSPQAWASAVPFSLVTSLLGLEVDGPADRLTASPCLPEKLGQVRLDHVSFHGRSVTLEAEGDRATVSPASDTRHE